MRPEQRDDDKVTRSRAVRRARTVTGLAVGVVVAAIVLVAGPAAASGSTRSAIAFWDLNDPLQTRVSVQGNTSATGQDAGSLFLFVTQSYCDTGTDQLVFRSFFSQSALAPGSFRVHPLLKSATLNTSTTVSGSEQRLQGCSSPSGFTFTDLGLSTVDAQVTWTATSEPYEVQPGITGRDATATGSIAGTSLSPGPVGTSQFAQLRSQAA